MNASRTLLTHFSQRYLSPKPYIRDSAPGVGPLTHFSPRYQPLGVWRFEVWDSGLRVEGVGCSVQVLGLRLQGFKAAAWHEGRGGGSWGRGCTPPAPSASTQPRIPALVAVYSSPTPRPLQGYLAHKKQRPLRILQ